MTKRIGEDTLVVLHQALDNVVLRFVVDVDVGDEAKRNGVATILPHHIDTVAARTGGGAPPIPDQLVDVIDRLQAKQTPPAPPAPPQP